MKKTSSKVPTKSRLVFVLPLITKAIQEGSIKCNFAGVALGDSWISPLGMLKILRLSLILLFIFWII